MKKLMALMLLCVLFVNPALADKHRSQGEGMMGDGHGSGMGMMHGEQMQERMRTMHEKMNQAREAGDPERRRELMREHMQSMQSTMQTMRRDMGSGASGDIPMERRMERMEQHMQMMQGMMERESLEE